MTDAIAPSSSNVLAPTPDLVTPTSAPLPPWTQMMLAGALVQISRTDPTSKSIVAFQYNPETLTRSLSPSYYQSRKDTLTGPAKQSIDVTIQLEASGQGWSTLTGILPQLAALEMMINPSSDFLSAYQTSLQSNKMEAVPPVAPRILFIWGPSRVLPVLITSMTIKEKMFNQSLTPVVADVDLKMELYPFAQAGAQDTAYLITNVSLLEGFAAANISIRLIGVNPLGLT
jgi:hypothetical protein